METDPEADEAVIRRLIAEQVDAYNRGDAAAFLETIAEDRVGMNPGQPVSCGRGDRGELQSFFDSVEQTIELEVDEVVVFGDWAFDRGSGKGTLSPKAANNGLDPEATYSYKYIRIWHRKDDGWKVSRSIWNTNG
ncbi:MAG: DUF4440 domain-containing protein [Acidobacteriota bacterium]